MVHGRERTKRCLVYVGPRFGSFCVLLLKKINKYHVFVCKNHVNIYLLDVLTWKL